MNYNTIRILDPKVLHTDPNPCLEIFYTDPWKKNQPKKLNFSKQERKETMNIKRNSKNARISQN